MDDRLQRRLRDADPLAAAEGQLPDPARLDAIKEQLMLSETEKTGGAPESPAPRRGLMRPRAIGVTAMAAVGLAAVLVVGSLARPASSALAWDPIPTTVSAAQKAAAEDACSAGLASVPLAGEAQGSTATEGRVQEGGPIMVTAGGVEGAVPETGVSSGGTITGGDPSTIQLPPFATELPPLTYMEQHGTGAVAVFADKETTAYCLLVKQGDGYQIAALQFPLPGGGAMGIGTVVGSTGASMSTMAMAGDGDFQVTAMTVEYDGGKVGIIAGSAPDGAASIKVEGGPADGATATVNDGRFALWAPKAPDAEARIVALDGAGAELGSVTIGGPPPDGAPVVVSGELPEIATPAP